MAVKLNSGRSKSTSDILDEVTDEKEMSEADSFPVENKYRPYTVDDLGEEVKCRKHLDCERNKERSSQKPQNFVKKLIASLEKKNEACKADDEFLAKYYKRNDYLNPNCDYSNDIKLRFPENVKRFNREKYSPDLNIRTNETHSDNCRQNENIEKDMLPNIRISIFSNGKMIKQSTSIKPFIQCSSKRGIEDPKNQRYSSRRYVQQHDSRKSVDVNVNDERKDQTDSSSFDPNRSRVKLENRIDTRNSCLFKRNKDDPERRSYERIFIDLEDEDTLKTGSTKKKVHRRKSFKDFFGSIIRWKKSEEKEKSWRYLSYDHLLDQSDEFSSKSRKLSRSMSFQTMVFRGDEGNVSQIKERKATIRPIYGGKRCEHRLELRTKKFEDRIFSYNGKHCE